MLDVEPLLEPITADKPTGENLREQPSDVTFQELSENRTEIPPEDDPSGEGHDPNWTAAARICKEALEEKTKDLDLSSYLTEAAIRVGGFEGLRDGLRLTNGLLNTFWDRIHPGFDEEDDEIVYAIRARPITWLGTSQDFLRTVRMAPLASCNDGRTLSWEDYTNTDMVDERRSQSGEEAYRELVAAGYLGRDEWTARISSVSAEVLRATLEVVSEAEAELQELRAITEKLFEEDEPNLVPLGELVLDVREYLEARIPSEGGGDSASEASVATGAGAETASVGAGASAGPISSRGDALRRLSEVAEFFQRTEPHSPISHLVQRTVRWGNMSLEDLLVEIVKDDSVLSRIWDTLGINRSDDAASGSGGSQSGGSESNTFGSDYNTDEDEDDPFA